MNALAAPTWTPERIEELRAYAAQGLNAAQIAFRMKPITELAIIGRAARLGIELGVKPASKQPARRGAVEADDTGDPMFGVEPPPRQDAWLPIDGAEPVALVDLGANQCPWPICGDDWEAPTHAHCGRARPDGLPYCPEHTALAYQGGHYKRGGAMARAFINSALRPAR